MVEKINNMHKQMGNFRKDGMGRNEKPNIGDEECLQHVH